MIQHHFCYCNDNVSVDGGEITIDGVSLPDFDPRWLRGRALGYINQEPVLFATSVIENIRYGRPEATDQEVQWVAGVNFDVHNVIVIC